jgi:hypothetical protein
MYRWCEAMPFLDLREDRAARRAHKRVAVVQVEFAETDDTLSTQEGPVHYSTGDALLTGTEDERWPFAATRLTSTTRQWHRPGRASQDDTGNIREWCGRIP